MYPFIRFFLLQSANEDKQGLHSPYDSVHIGKIQEMKYIVKSFLYRPKKVQSDIIFFGSDISNIYQGNAYFNRLTESFANEYSSKSILIERANKMKYKRPRTYPYVFARDTVNITANIIVKFKYKLLLLKSGDLNQINSFLQYLKQYFNYDFTDNVIWDEIKDTLIDFSKKLPYLYKGYIRLLKKLSPKIIFLDCACYGGDNIPLIMAAKDLKIPIGEYQHGLISLAHPAYNYSAGLSDSYKYYMPDFYMSYGKYWIKNSRIPIKVMEIGNPYLSDSASCYGQIVKKEQLLYISSAVTPERYVKEVIWLNNRLADIGCSVIFRHHPSETARLETVYKPIIDAGIKIDTQPLYDTLKYTKYLVGDYSTVFFEAALFDCFIFVIKTSYNKENIDLERFNSCLSMEEIVENIIFKKFKRTDSNDFWNENWRSKYHQLIDNYLYY